MYYRHIFATRVIFDYQYTIQEVQVIGNELGIQRHDNESEGSWAERVLSAHAKSRPADLKQEHERCLVPGLAGAAYESDYTIVLPFASDAAEANVPLDGQ